MVNMQCLQTKKKKAKAHPGQNWVCSSDYFICTTGCSHCLRWQTIWVTKGFFGRRNTKDSTVTYINLTRLPGKHMVIQNNKEKIEKEEEFKLN